MKIFRRHKKRTETKSEVETWCEAQMEHLEHVNDMIASFQEQFKEIMKNIEEEEAAWTEEDWKEWNELEGT